MRDSLRQLTLTRFREFLREPEAVFWTFAFPILLATGLGIAFRNRPAERAHVGIAGNPAATRAVLSALRASSEIAPESLDIAEARTALRTGRLALVVNASAPNRVEYEFDQAREDSRMARLLVDVALQRAAGQAQPVSISELRIREPGSRYIDFVIPGLLGMGLMGSGIWGIGFTIVDARRKRLLKRFMATPMSRAEYLGSFVISRFTFLILEVGLLLTFAVLFFGVPLRGPVWELALICILGALTFGALGLLIAARPRTIEGANGLMNLAMVPMWIFSGVFFSSENFPRVIQPFVQALPLTAVNDALRANMLRGAGFSVVGPELAIALAWTAVCFVLALRLFRWR
jgi:ABC-type multidrug transport system permease subunit